MAWATIERGGAGKGDVGAKAAAGVVLTSTGSGSATGGRAGCSCNVSRDALSPRVSKGDAGRHCQFAVASRNSSWHGVRAPPLKCPLPQAWDPCVHAYAHPDCVFVCVGGVCMRARVSRTRACTHARMHARGRACIYPRCAARQHLLRFSTLIPSSAPINTQASRGVDPNGRCGYRRWE